jgi:hypothetical protein
MPPNNAGPSVLKSTSDPSFVFRICSRKDGEHNTSERRAGRDERRVYVNFVSAWRRGAGFIDYGVDAIDR